MGTQNGHNVPFLESASLKKWKRKAMKKIKQIHKISKKGNNKKKSCRLVPKVVIDLPFEGRLKETRNTEEGREFQRQEIEGKKPSLNRLILALESSTQ